MSWEKRIVWSEGMLLQPQHFQQQSRHFDSQIRNASQIANVYNWGIDSIDIDTSQLSIGKICINSATGILPDGSYFNIPNIDGVPMAIDVSDTLLNKVVYLSLNIRRHGNTEVCRDSDDNKSYRYFVEEIDARDVSGHSNLEQVIEVAGYKLCLLTELDNLNEFSCIPICLIENISSSGKVALKENFIPPYLNIKSNLYLRSFLTELVNLINHRINSLSARVSIAGKATTTEVTDFLMLQALNRNQPLVRYLESAESVNPLDVYLQLTSLISEMSTFLKADKQSPQLPIYDHNNLTTIFDTIINELRQIFSIVLEQNSINIPLKEKKYGIRVGVVADKTLFKSGSFILAVNADIQPDEIRKYFPSQVKIGAVEQIKELVNVQLPGILLNNLAVAPREIPYQRNFVYFELVPKGEYWNALVKSGGIAIHIGTNFPNLSMELWAIRGGSE